MSNEAQAFQTISFLVPSLSFLLVFILFLINKSSRIKEIWLKIKDI